MPEDRTWLLGYIVLACMLYLTLYNMQHNQARTRNLRYRQVVSKRLRRVDSCE